MIARRATFYGLLGLVLASTLRELGFELGVLLGAAGVLTVALGFASQTSASNLISGLFLIVERPFVVGDAIRIEDVTGEVLSIDLLSVKIRTFDNLFVRVPNESIIKSRVTTLTHFPIRRMDLEIGVAYREDLDRVRLVLLDLAHRDPYIFVEPEPLFLFKGFGASSLDIQFSVWARRENFIHTRTRFLMDVKREFDRQGIEIPFPHVSLYTGSETAPFPVRAVGARAEGEGGEEAPPS
jgi:small-conductance mechanosensitive channel